VQIPVYLAQTFFLVGRRLPITTITTAHPYTNICHRTIDYKHTGVCGYQASAGSACQLHHLPGLHMRASSEVMTPIRTKYTLHAHTSHGLVLICHALIHSCVRGGTPHALHSMCRSIEVLPYRSDHADASTLPILPLWTQQINITSGDRYQSIHPMAQSSPKFSPVF